MKKFYIVQTSLLATFTGAFAQATAAQSSEDIRDIKEPVFLPDYLAWVYLTVALAVISFSAWIIWKKFLQKTPPPETQYQRAIRELQQAARFLDEGQTRQYCIMASGIIRLYLEQALGQRAAHMTTAEFLNDLSANSNYTTQTIQEPLKHFLELCDLVKFARWKISPEQASELSKAANKVVEEAYKASDLHSSVVNDNKSQNKNLQTTNS